MPGDVNPWLPLPTWLRSYERPWLRGDLVAGLTLAAFLLPAGIAYASLADLPPDAGLYACLCGGLVFWIFCSSRFTAVTVTSSISLLIGVTLRAMAPNDPDRFRALAAATALLVALIAFLSWLFGAGAIVNFISETVMLGFKCGVALTLTVSQLPKLFGFKGGHGGFWKESAYFFRHAHETNMASLMLGLVALALLFGGKMLLKNQPVSLMVVVLGIVASAVFGLDRYGVALLGEVPRGLPHLRIPAISRQDVDELGALAFACFLLGAVEQAAVGRMFAAKHGGRLDNNQELLALATANLAAGLGQGYPIAGGLSQSLVNEDAGAKTPLSGFFAAIIVLLVAVFLSGLLRDLPQPVLAAVVLMSVVSLFNISQLRQVRHVDGAEYISAMAALVGVLTLGLLRGVLLGAVISMVLLIRRASRPHVALLGRIPGSRRFSDRDRHPDNELIDGVSIFRPESSLIYFNIDHVRDTIANAVRAHATPPRLVIIDLSAAPYVDIQSAEALAGLAKELSASGIRLQVVEARSAVRDRLRAAGVDEKLGGINRFSTIADVLDAAPTHSS